jgi:phosphatidylglycerol:prolipoprotein diacylglycerol transferase
MHPFIQFPFGPPISTYGVFLALAHLAGTALLLTLAARRGFRVADFVDLIFVVLFTGLIGARIVYVWGHTAEFAGRWTHVFWLWEGGLSFHGGFFLAFPAYLAFLWWRRIPVWEASDVAAPVLPLAMAVVRLGCFCAGCCFGIPTHLPWGVRLHSAYVPAELAAEHLHPTQLYESALLFLLSAFLLREFFRARWPKGTLGILSIFLYAWIRLFLDFLRGDLIHGFLGVRWLTFSQAAAILMILSGAGLLGWVYRRYRALPG